MSTRRPFDPGDEGLFSVDDKTGQLFWNDQLVHTETVVSLTKRQAFWGGVAATAAILAAVAGLGSCVADLKSAFFSKAEKAVETTKIVAVCPVPPSPPPDMTKKADRNPVTTPRPRHSRTNCAPSVSRPTTR